MNETINAQASNKVWILRKAKELKKTCDQIGFASAGKGVLHLRNADVKTCDGVVSAVNVNTVAAKDNVRN
jgi:hypothetical protein